MRSGLLRCLGRLLRLVCLAGAGAALHAMPVTVEYELVPRGGTNYEYRYTVTNVSQAAPPVQWFAVDFDPALYDELSLMITSVGTGDWLENLFPPFLSVPAQFDAYKTTGAPLAIGESASGFAVEFSWLGAGTPGGQTFTLYDPDTLDIILTGTTTLRGGGPPTGVPEPSSAALVLFALIGAAALRRR